MWGHVAVWQKLENENQEFFRAYHLRLIVKDQILRFNQLLEKQVELMQQIFQTGAAPIPQTNGSQTHPRKLVSQCTIGAFILSLPCLFREPLQRHLGNDNDNVIDVLDL